MNRYAENDDTKREFKVKGNTINSNGPKLWVNLDITFGITKNWEIEKCTTDFLTILESFKKIENISQTAQIRFSEVKKLDEEIYEERKVTGFSQEIDETIHNNLGVKFFFILNIFF